MESIFNFLKDEKGQGLTEYALIIALIAVAVVAVMIIFRNQIQAIFESATDAMQDTEVSPNPAPMGN